jgi:MoaA/NifB/PqqE/SkfB family radical SAM enzyme
MEYRKRYLDAAILKDRLSEMGRLGIKSIMYAGEGEPLLNKQIGDIINHTKKAGIDPAISTNGVLLSPSLAERILGDLEWLKVSINGATGNTYSRIHRTKPSDLNAVLDNLSYASKIKRQNRYRCALGMQLLLLPENKDEVVVLAERAKDIGMDYLVIKPYSQHPLSKTDRYKDMKYNHYLDLIDELSKFNDSAFSVIFRIRTMKKWDDGLKNYHHCLALPFWSYVDAGAHVWGCSVYLGDERFYYGNLYQSSFREIWDGEKRLKSLRWVENDLDSSQCRVNCRMDEINRYLWELKHLPEHVNFI